MYIHTWYILRIATEIRLQPWLEVGSDGWTAQGKRQGWVVEVLERRAAEHVIYN